MDIREHVEQFRKAFIEVLVTFEEIPNGIKNFPCGACEVSSVMLMTYLKSIGADGITCISGTRPSGREGQMQSHSWLSYNDSFIDITSSQFSDCDNKILISSNHKLHASFNYEDRGTSDIYQYSTEGSVDYVPFYENVVSKIK